MTNNTEKTVELSRKHVKRFRDLLREETGLALDEPKLLQRLRRILKKEIQAHEVQSAGELLEAFWYEESYRETIQEIVNQCLINETLFYRYADQMKRLTEDVFPALHTAVPDSEPITVLSMGCSNGAEPYSAVMAYLEACRENAWDPDDCRIRVVGVDASTAALEEARDAVYPGRPVRNAPGEIVDRYFEEVGNNRYQVCEAVRERVTFQFLNVLTTSPPLLHDLVLCRNVMMYFDEATREKLVRRLHTSLKEGGYVLVSPSEDLQPYAELFQSTRWASDHVYEVWSTDRRRSTVGTEDNDENKTFDRDRRESIQSKPAATITSSIDPDSRLQKLRIQGVAGANMSPRVFQGRLQTALRPDMNEYVLDLRDADYLSNPFLRLLRRPVEVMLDDARRVIIVSDRDEYRRWVNLCFVDQRVQLASTLPDTENSSPAESQEENVSDEVESEDSFSSQPPEPETETIQASRNSLTPEPDSEPTFGLVDVDPEAGDVEFRGRYDASEDSSLTSRLESELLTAVERINQQTAKSSGTIVLDLGAVEFLDRELVPVLNRFYRRTKRASISIEVNCDRSLEDTLRRWGCEFL